MTKMRVHELAKELGIEKERCIAKTAEFYEEDKL